MKAKDSLVTVEYFWKRIADTTFVTVAGSGGAENCENVCAHREKIRNKMCNVIRGSFKFNWELY